eukprot:GEZU01006502.1.p2 GENE.GEZU01006502.1~~GEZU01006502.1.p2  ORF type:complete len:112 (+),score=12.70 GEZU01006502.1:362-697(+)
MRTESDLLRARQPEKYSGKADKRPPMRKRSHTAWEAAMTDIHRESRNGIWNTTNFFTEALLRTFAALYYSRRGLNTIRCRSDNAATSLARPNAGQLEMQAIVSRTIQIGTR